MSTVSKVEARFRCDSATSIQPGTITLNMHADYNNGKGNEDFANATPWGQLTMGISEDRPAASFFKQGKRYKVTFEEQEEG